MPRTLRRRFWTESAVGSVAGAVGILTIFWSDWIEAIFGVDPDHGNGSAEWLVVVVLLAVAVVLAVSARLEWRRAALAGT